MIAARSRSMGAMLALVALGGCKAGPDYARPELPGTSTSASFVRAKEVISSAPTLASWWTAFGDPVLDELERRALAANPSLTVAEARLRNARASFRLERANALPGANAQLSTIQARLPGVDVNSGNGAAGGGDSHIEFYNAGFDASWEINFFGGNSRKLEAARALIGVAEANVDDARLSLTADVAQSYARLRDRQQRITLAREAIASQRKTLMLVEQRFSRGAASDLDVQQIRTLVEAAEADLPLLLADEEALRNALAILVGEAPGNIDTLLGPGAPVPLPPASVAVGDPAALLRNRPDIRAAERRLAAETAKIGVAEAARFPSLRLIGLIGLGGTSLSDIGDLDRLTAAAAPALQWNILDFGRGKARVRQAEAARDEAEGNYRSAVLGALRDAEDALGRFGQRRVALGALARARAAADRSALLTRQRYDAGAASLIDLLDAERQRISADQRLAAGKADIASDFIALHKSLGLGWVPTSRND